MVLTKKVSVLLWAALILALVAPALLFAGNSDHSRKIVVFDETTALNESARDSLLKAHGAVKVKDLPLINASVVLLPSKAAERALSQDLGVLRVDDDVLVSAFSHKPQHVGDSVTQPPQSLPWGINRVDAELVWPTGNVADLVKVAIIDTGISKDHPDLAANVKGGYNAVNPTKGWNDDNGHGSHVAGTAAALNNTIGVVGVAPATNLYAVKVLNRQGSGFLSDVIEGIQWAVANGMQVANMSLGTSSNVQSFHDAVVAAYNAGLVLVAAAGNSGGAVGYPAAYPEVIAVSATDQNNNLAYFSSRGAEVD